MRSCFVSIASPWPWLVGAVMAAGSACGGSAAGPDGGLPAGDATPGAVGNDAPADVARTMDATFDVAEAFDSAAMDTGVGTDMGPAAQDSSGTFDAVPDGAIEGSSSTDAPPEASVAVDSAAADGSSPCSAMSGNDCVTCCANGNASGRGELDIVATQCMCASCTSSCTASTCTAHALPKSPCIACVKQSLAGSCAQNGYLDQYCGTTECHAYLTCLTQCPD